MKGATSVLLGFKGLIYFSSSDLATVLTNVTVERKSGGVVKLSSEEKERVLSILNRAIDKERGVLSPLAEDHPDGRELAFLL